MAYPLIVAVPSGRGKKRRRAAASRFWRRRGAPGSTPEKAKNVHAALEAVVLKLRSVSNLCHISGGVAKLEIFQRWTAAVIIKKSLPGGRETRCIR